MKRLMPITAVIILVGLAVTMATATAQKTQTEVEKLVGKYVQMWNTGDLSRADTFIAADFVRIGPSFEFDAQGLKGLETQVKRTRQDYANFTVEVLGVEIRGDQVILSWAVEGIYRSPEHPKSNNRPIALTGTSLYTIADGLIAAERASWDYLDGYTQIGIAPPTSPIERNIEIARNLLIEIYEKGNLDVAYDIIAREHEFHVPRGGSPKPGPQGVQERAMMFRKAFPDLEFTVDETVAAGDLVAFHWTFEGTQRGEFMGIAPTDRKIAISGLSLSRLSDGKLVESWGTWDTGELLAQLDVEQE